MLQTWACACYFHAWKEPGCWQPSEHPHPRLNKCRFSSSVFRILAWPCDDSLTHVTAGPPLIHRCIQGNDVISWGVLASSPASPSTTPTAELSLWRGEFREGHWSLVLLWNVSAGQMLTLNACFDAAVWGQFWANKAYLMASRVKKMKLQCVIWCWTRLKSLQW